MRGDNTGDCDGSCPKCTHSATGDGEEYGVDCSGFVSTIWGLPDDDPDTNPENNGFSTKAYAKANKRRKTIELKDALPGDAFYGWKLASENAWRLISPDSIRTDFAIANRRINEINATANDPKRREQAVDGYQEVKIRLESELDDETLKDILPSVEMLDDYSGQIPTFATTPTPNGNGTGNGNGNATPHIKDQKPTHPSVPVGPTKRPKFMPTISVPPPKK